MNSSQMGLRSMPCGLELVRLRYIVFGSFGCSDRRTIQAIVESDPLNIGNDQGVQNM